MNPLFSLFLPPQSLLLTLLNAVTGTGAGVSNTLKALFGKMTWEIVVTGDPTVVQVDLEGSINNSTWYALDSSTTLTSEMRHVVNKPVNYVRANLITLTAGTAPTVTVRFLGGGN
ncbi:MAG: hypothetical protein Q8M94_03900 [Ignavibacteria bacterium]|nr:hypothetical protein [Ignavibacteria bacterium]